jgi:ATP-binding cassette, subfamily C, bacterial exporter for protease/lipase
MAMQQQKKPAATSLLASAVHMSLYGMAVVAVLSFFVNLLVLVSPIYMQQVYDRVLTTHHLNTLAYLSLFTVICLVFLALFDGSRSYALTRIGRWWDETLRAEVMHAALFHSRVSGRIASTALTDLQTVRAFVGSPNVLPFFDVPWMPAFLLIIALLHPMLGAIAVGGAVILFSLAVWNDIVTRKAAIATSERSLKVSNFTGTSMRHADVVHAMGMFHSVIERIDNLSREISDISQVASDRTAIISAITKAVRIGIQIAILGVGAYFVTYNELTAGGMIAASIILGRALTPVEQALGAWKSFSSARISYRRLNALLAQAPPLESRTALPKPTGRLSVEGLFYSLPGQQRPILRNIDFRVQPGTVVAVVGPSASGKSTLCKLLVGSWNPSSGNVRLDGADISHLDRDQVGRYVGYMPQSVELFGGTVRDNIARLSDASDEEVVSAAQTAGCHEMILGIKGGYDSDIGEAGSYLSGGQRQRIALARAVLRMPRLVVLDEPNSNLDSEGETKLAGTIKQLKDSGATVFIVSHRALLFTHVDVIAVMREGVLEKFGPRDEVLAALNAQGQSPRTPGAVVQAVPR